MGVDEGISQTTAADSTRIDKGDNYCQGMRTRLLVGGGVGHSHTYAAIEMLAAEMGLTSFTSKAFCRASFLLAASSCSSSSLEDYREPKKAPYCNASLNVLRICRDFTRCQAVNKGNTSTLFLNTALKQYLSQLLCVCEVIDSDSQEDIQ